MRRPSLLIPLTTIFFFLFSCKTIYQPGSVQYKDYKITSSQPANSEINVFLKLYADSVSHSMSDVVAVAAKELEKKQPEGTLGNLLADAMLIMSKQSFQTNVDAAFLNYGGIRIQSLAAGNITRGKIFEITPFDNLIVLQKVQGSVLKQFLDFIADKGGWPCSGISFKIKNKKAVNIYVGNNPLNETSYYYIANTDYIVNGGDDCIILKGIVQQNKGYVFRDAVIDYFSKLNTEGKPISANIENRISYAE